MKANARADHCILVVEDDDDVREVACAILVHEGYAVVQCHNGLEALDYLRSRNTRPDLIVLDLVMPTMDGWEFRVKQRRDPAISSIPVLAISADTSSRAAAIDADAYLTKPYSSDILLDTIDRIVLGRQQSWLRSEVARSWQRAAAGDNSSQRVGGHLRLRAWPVGGDARAAGSDAADLAAQRALRAATIGFINGSPLNQILRDVVVEACGLVGACCGALRVFGASGKRVVDVIGPACCLNIPDDPPDKAGQLLPASFIDTLVRTRTAPGALLSVPLRDGDELLGTLYLGDKKGAGGFTSDDEGVLERYCGHAALILRMCRHIETVARDGEGFKMGTTGELARPPKKQMA